MTVQDVFLKPGEWFFGGTDTCIRTTLGSCVAFTFWHADQLNGGMCHYMLPDRSRFSGVGRPLDGRYADEALTLMEQAISRSGGFIRDYHIKIFGGASMFSTDMGRDQVSMRNIEMAWALVEQYQLKVVAQNLGGSVYRQLVFDIRSGDVYMKKGMPSPDERHREVR